MLEFERRNQRTTKIEKEGLMNILKREFENYRIKQKRGATTIWVEAFCTGLIVGVAIMTIVSYWIIK